MINQWRWQKSQVFFLLNDQVSFSSSASLCYHFLLLFHLFFSFPFSLPCPSIPSSLPSFSGELSPDLDSWPSCNTHMDTRRNTHSGIQHTQAYALTHTDLQTLLCAAAHIHLDIGIHTYTIVVNCSKCLDCLGEIFFLELCAWSYW